MIQSSAIWLCSQRRHRYGHMDASDWAAAGVGRGAPCRGGASMEVVVRVKVYIIQS